MLSGAILDPSALRDLLPDFVERGAPLASPVHHDAVYFLTRAGKIKFPITPPPLANHGNYVISLNRFVKWLAGLVEAEGIDLFTGFPASELLFDGDAVAGVRTGDRGIGKHGERKSTFEAGVEIRAKVTILADGVRGNLTKSLVRQARARRWSQPAAVCVGNQGAVGGPRRIGSRPEACSTRWGIRYGWTNSAAGSSTRCPRASCPWALWRGSTIAIRCSIRTSRFSISSGIHWCRRCSTGDSWCATAPRRSRKAAGTRYRSCTPAAP